MASPPQTSINKEITDLQVTHFNIDYKVSLASYLVFVIKFLIYVNIKWSQPLLVNHTVVYIQTIRSQNIMTTPTSSTKVLYKNRHKDKSFHAFNFRSIVGKTFLICPHAPKFPILLAIYIGSQHILVFIMVTMLYDLKNICDSQNG